MAKIIGEVKRINPKLLTLIPTRVSYGSKVADEVSLPIKPEIYVALLEHISNYQQRRESLYLLVETDEKGYACGFQSSGNERALRELLESESMIIRKFMCENMHITLEGVRLLCKRADYEVATERVLMSLRKMGDKPLVVTEDIIKKILEAGEEPP